jgi:hypothetical protein
MCKELNGQDGKQVLGSFAYLADFKIDDRRFLLLTLAQSRRVMPNRHLLIGDQSPHQILI